MKMTTINGAQIRFILKTEMKMDVETEDRIYEIKPLAWYLDNPWYGRKRYPYITDAQDCDDMCTIAKFEWLKKHYKKIGGRIGRTNAYGQSRGGGGGAQPALPMFQAKVELNNGTYHWIMVVVTTQGIKYIERNETSMVIALNIKRFVRIHI